MALTITDPEAAVYSQLVSLFTSSNNFNSLIGKIIDLATFDPSQQIPTAAQHADLPQLIIIPTTAKIELWGVNSLTTEFCQTFRLVLVTDSLNLPNYTQFKMVILAILSQAGCTLGLPGLVRNVKIKQQSDFIAPNGWSRETKRFSGFCDVEITSYVSAQTIQEWAL